MTLLLTVPIHAFIVGALKHTEGSKASVLPVKLVTTLLTGICQGLWGHSLVLWCADNDSKWWTVRILYSVNHDEISW